MDQRIVDFIAGLRAAGVRVSLAESADAMRAIEQIGVIDRSLFKTALRTTLVKEASDQPMFEKLFPLYFGSGGPPLTNPQAGLTPEQKKMLQAALRALMNRMGQPQKGQSGQQGQRGQQDQMSQSEINALAQMLAWLLSGQGPTQQELQQMAQQAGMQHSRDLSDQNWMSQRMMRQMGMNQLNQLLEQLWQELQKAGMSQEAIQELKEMVEANKEALREQVSQFIGSSLAKQATENVQPKQDEENLMNRPFTELTESEADVLRKQVNRLAARLRSRAALRQRRGKKGVLDAKATIRANLRFGGVPLDIHHKKKHLKPKVVLFCDLSTSMRPVVEFMLMLMYEMQDQIAKARSFAYISDLTEISDDFETLPPRDAIQQVMTNLHPGHYNTDLGTALATFCKTKLDAVDRRTTVIILGDGRNNYNDPRLDSFQDIKRRSRRVIWMNPEPFPMWRSGDSDMHRYAPLCDSVHMVGNLAQLVAAVDALFGMK